MLSANLNNLAMNIHKPRLDHLILPRLDHGHALAELLAGLVHLHQPVPEILRLLETVVIGKDGRVDGLDLEIAARFEVLERAAEQAAVVRDEAGQLAAVDEVEGARVDPFGFVVVDFECAVWGDPVIIRSACSTWMINGRGLPLWLDRTQIRACSY